MEPARSAAMPARDTYHDEVRNALIKDAWTVTNDPLILRMGSKDLYVDLGAERLLAAEKDQQQIAVEIKSFVGRSEIDDLEKALGQFTLYHDVLAETDPGRVLYLAVPVDVLRDVFQEPLGQLLLKNKRLRLIVFDPVQEVILQWMP
jgi:XisH protein